MRYIFLILFFQLFFACKNNKESDSRIENSEFSLATIKITSDILTYTDSSLERYYALKNAFVEDDSNEIDISARALSASLDNIMTFAQNDSILPISILNGLAILRVQSDSLLLNGNLIAKRRSFSILSDTLYSVLQQLQFSGHRVYRQVCPMAFNDSETAHWLSQNSEVENPYLGKKHPKYGSGMLHCGEIMDSLNYRR